MKLLVKGLVGVTLIAIAQPVFAMGQTYSRENQLEGQSVPDFTLTSVNGSEMNLNKWRAGQNAILFFWATWCPHCREHLVELNTMAKGFEQKGVKIILVDVGEDLKTVKEFLDRHKIQFEALLDQDSTIAEKFQIIGVPTFFFVDKNGTVKAAMHSLPNNYEEIFN